MKSEVNNPAQSCTEVGEVDVVLVGARLAAATVDRSPSLGAVIGRYKYVVSTFFPHDLRHVPEMRPTAVRRRVASEIWNNNFNKRIARVDDMVGSGCGWNDLRGATAHSMRGCLHGRALAVFPDYKGLRASVEAERGLITTTMEELRKLHGAGRLGVRVRAAISEELAAHGLGHLPEQLPRSQESLVRIYKVDSPISSFLHAISHPSAASDELLRRLNMDHDQGLLKKVREQLDE